VGVWELWWATGSCGGRLGVVMGVWELRWASGDCGGRLGVVAGDWELRWASGNRGGRLGVVAGVWELWHESVAGWLLPAVTQDRRGHHIIILYSVVQDHAAHAPSERTRARTASKITLYIRTIFCSLRKIPVVCER
jgi:putative component of toxin-antitoxin plasmid stabilization module